MDGTDLPKARFNNLKEKRGYQKTNQTDPDQMSSCVQMNRLLEGLSFLKNFHFQSVFKDPFLGRIKHEQPDLMVLFIDKMRTFPPQGIVEPVWTEKSIRASWKGGRYRVEQN